MIAAVTDIRTKQEFGDVQVHVEYAVPNPPTGGDMDRGNSGIFLMGLFELQVFDSYQRAIYADGQAGAVYAQTPPMVNACLPPGEWQVYDIAFTAPRLDGLGNVSTPAYVTVFHNGVLIQNHTAILGPTGPGQLADYHKVHRSKGPILLQFHPNAVRYRSVWVRIRLFRRNSLGRGGLEQGEEISGLVIRAYARRVNGPGYKRCRCAGVICRPIGRLAIPAGIAKGGVGFEFHVSATPPGWCPLFLVIRGFRFVLRQAQDKAAPPANFWLTLRVKF